MADQDDVRRLALALPEVTESADHFAFSVPTELAELLTDAWRCQAPRALVTEYDN